MEREHNLLIMSDLHLSEGFDPKSGKTSRLEDFLFDGAFARFLRYHEAARGQPRFGGRPWLLILNGDLFDFLQVVSMPEEGLPLRTIKGAVPKAESRRRSPVVALAPTGGLRCRGVAHAIARTPQGEPDAMRGVERREELPPNERTFGLGTTAKESEWKLKQIARGHQRFFAALGWFVAHGNHVAVVKGNHDVELHWEEVQERFVVEAKRAYTRQRLRTGSGPALALEAGRERIHFYPWFYHEPGRVYVEHGCQYEALNHFRNFLNPVLPDDPERIELPWGSLFVRYLFNEVEDVHPFADNVKPLTRYLTWAFRKDPGKAIEVLVIRGWIFLRALWKVAHKTAASVLHAPDERGQREPLDLVPLPEEVTEQIKALAQRRVDAAWQDWLGSALQGLFSLLVLLIIGTLLAFAALSLAGAYGSRWMAIPYLVAAAFAYFVRRELGRGFSRLLERNYLQEAARELERILPPAHAVRYIVMGHDHRAAVERLERAWYVNTGAWVPLYEREGPIEGREELTFFRLAWDYEGTPELLRWDDAAGEPARVVLRGEAGS